MTHQLAKEANGKVRVNIEAWMAEKLSTPFLFSLK
jgi:hypothetical protein